MSIDLTAVDRLIAHLDTCKGAFWTPESTIDPTRALAVDFIIVNADGEPMQTNSLAVANFHHLISQITPLPEEQSHPCHVLNGVWGKLKGTGLIGAPDQVAGFVVDLLENRIDVTITDKAGDVTSASAQCGIATRMFVLRDFCSIQEGLVHAFHSWVGQVKVIFNAETGTIAIDGIQQPAEPVAEAEPEVPAKVTKKRAAKPAAVKAPVKAPARPRAATSKAK